MAPVRNSRNHRAAVVVTCHNEGRGLGASVESVLGTGEAVELVVVDDGSSDELTLILLDQLAGKGVTVLRQRNQGQSAATMTGVRATAAPYLMRFDADDVLLPGALTALGDALDANPRAAAAWGDVETSGLTTFRVPAAPQLDPWLVTYTNCIPGSGALYRRSALAESGGWELQEGFEDWDVWMRLAELGHTGIYVKRPIFRYDRDGAGQLSTWLPQTEQYYEELRTRHPKLFLNRPANRRKSQTPLALRLAVRVVERVPGLPRLRRIQLSEMFTHLLWNGGIAVTARMILQAVAWRVRRQ